MTSMAAELNGLRSNPIAWVWVLAWDIVNKLVLVGAVALVAAIPLHFTLASVGSALGYPHHVGGYWACTLLVLGLVTVALMIAIVLNVALDGLDVLEHLNVRAYGTWIAALGVAAWLATWLGPHLHT